MPVFGTNSKAKLATADQRLQDLFNTVIQYRDCAVTEGYRDQAAQDQYFAEGKSKEKWPNGKHNRNPSVAVDVVPFIGGQPSYDYAECVLFAGFVFGVASMMDIKLRWGGNWSGDLNLHGNSFNDMVHFELLGVQYENL